MMTEHIGKQIAALRKAKGVKQEELASYVGVSAQAVSKWENGGGEEKCAENRGLLFGFHRFPV